MTEIYSERRISDYGVIDLAPASKEPIECLKSQID